MNTSSSDFNKKRTETPASERSAGVESVCDIESMMDDSNLVAGDFTSTLVDDLVKQSVGEQIMEKKLKAQVEQLQSELSNAKSEADFAAAERSKLEEENELASQTIQGLKQQVQALVSQAQASQQELSKTKELLAKISTEKDTLQSSHNSLEGSLKKTTDDLKNAKKDLDQSQGLTADRDVLHKQISKLSGDLQNSRSELAEAQKQIDQCGDIPDALNAANEQVAQLNTQIAHLYAQLTLARTELEQARDGQGGNEQDNNAAEAAKQNSQIADLVSDIRHLQLDLEYHQQKLDQLIDEKQMMMQQVKKSQDELAMAKQQIQERDQLLKHKEIDLQRSMQEAKITNSDQDSHLSEQNEALRKEAAAKDSALIVSHYELHKEKLLRDRLEQKNLKLMERLQKLMMVVETQRKENFSVEKQLATHQKLVEDKDHQLREVSHKAKQLQKAFKAQSGKTPRGATTSPKQNSGSMNTDAFMSQGLPPIA